MQNYGRHKKMKKALLPLLALLTFSPLAFAGNCNNNQIFQSDPALVNPKLAQSAYKLCFMEYTVVYSGLSKTPLWSAEHLTQDRINQAHSVKRINSFHEESQIPFANRSLLKDYARTGYDRGHMSPSGDMSNPQAQFESFTLANMIPQNPNDNRNLWEGVESSVRNYVEDGHDVYTVTGPIFGGNQALPGGELIPTKIFKAVYDATTNKAGVYLVKNEDGNYYEMISLNDLRQLSGIDAFPSLSNAIKSSVADLPAPHPHGSEGGRTRKPKKSKWW